MHYFLNKEELTDLLMAQDLMSDDEYSVYASNELYNFYLNYIESRGVKINKENLIKNNTKKYQFSMTNGFYCYKELSQELVVELAYKIQLFSDNFWTLFDYTKNGFKNDWKTSFIDLKESKETTTLKIDYLKRFKDKGLSFALTNYLENVKVLKNRYVVLWYNLNKNNRDLLESEVLPSFIDRIDYLNSLDSTMLLKAKVIALFKKELAYDKLIEIYENKKGSTIEEDLVKIIRKFSSNFNSKLIPLFEEEKKIIHYHILNIDPASLVQQYKISKESSKNFFKVLEYIVNSERAYTVEMKFANCYSYEYEKYKDYFVAKIYGFSDMQLEQEVKWFKNLLNDCCNLLLNSPSMFTENNIKNTLEHNNMAELIKQLYVYNDYKVLDNKIDYKNNTQVIKKQKI